jgi:hypothetical protein
MPSGLTREWNPFADKDLRQPVESGIRRRQMLIGRAGTRLGCGTLRHRKKIASAVDDADVPFFFAKCVLSYGGGIAYGSGLGDIC